MLAVRIRLLRWLSWERLRTTEEQGKDWRTDRKLQERSDHRAGGAGVESRKADGAGESGSGSQRTEHREGAE